MLKFISFGSGSSGNCYYLANNHEALLIDAGIGIRKLKKYFFLYDINPATIKGVLITHDHADHIGSVKLYSKYLNLNFYASPLVARHLCYGNPKFRIQTDFVKPIEEKQMIRIGDFEVTPFKLPHDASDNYGYSIHLDGKTFTIMTDIGCPTQNVTDNIRNSDYLVIESDYDPQMLAMNPKYDLALKERIKGGYGHLSNVQTAQLIAQNLHHKLKFVALCHLSGENNSPELAKSTIAEKLKQTAYEGQLQLEVLLRNTPIGPFILD